MRQSVLKTLLALFALLLSNPPVYAWSESGHHLIALLAFDQLKPAEQERLLEILAAHPRYREDFTPPEKIRDVDRWRIGTAGYWPDIARRQPKYNRPTWHYELGATLVLGDESQVNLPETPGRLPDDATMKTQELYIAQAIDLCVGILIFQKSISSESDKALAVCWLAHLVGDAHQPLHAGSLYAEGLFPDGDRGANSIPTRQKNNMHALWDGLLGGNYNEGSIARRLRETAEQDLLKQAKTEIEKRSLQFLDEHERSDASARKAIFTNSMRVPQFWLPETRELAVEWVYTSEALGPIHAAMNEHTQIPTINFSEDYLVRAGNLAKLQAAIASYRLAYLWRAALRDR